MRPMCYMHPLQRPRRQEQCAHSLRGGLGGQSESGRTLGFGERLVEEGHMYNRNCAEEIDVENRAPFC